MIHRSHCSDDLAVVFAGEGAAYSGKNLRTLYDYIIEEMTAHDIPPTHAAANGTALRMGKYRTFVPTHRRILKSSFDELHDFSLIYAADSARITYEENMSYAGITRLPPAEKCVVNARWQSLWELFPNQINLPEAEAVKILVQFAARSNIEYGFIFRMIRSSGPRWFSHGIIYNGAKHRTHAENDHISTWFWPERADLVLLRDVYPYNFFARRFLNMPLASGVTLERWILADPSRGTLEPINDRIMMWRPPVERIPQLRESLFLEGAILYREFLIPSSPSYRDFNRPFKWKGPIPEIFRASFYEGRDPGITR